MEGSHAHTEAHRASCLSVRFAVTLNVMRGTVRFIKVF